MRRIISSGLLPPQLNYGSSRRGSESRINSGGRSVKHNSGGGRGSQGTNRSRKHPWYSSRSICLPTIYVRTLHEQGTSIPGVLYLEIMRAFNLLKFNRNESKK